MISDALPSDDTSPVARPSDGAIDPVRVEHLLAQNTALAVELGAARKRAVSADASDEVKRLRAELKDRFREIATLTAMLESGGVSDEKEHDALTEYVASLEHAHLSVLSSTSWKVTRPLRAILRVLRRQPKPEPFSARFLHYSE